jgi:hypothetical protein
MGVRATFRVEYIKPFDYQNFEIKLSGPNGSVLYLRSINRHALEKFVTGEEIYVDFTPAVTPPETQVQVQHPL